MDMPLKVLEGGKVISDSFFYGKAVAEFTREELLGLAYFFMSEMEEYREIAKRSYDNNEL